MEEVGLGEDVGDGPGDGKEDASRRRWVMCSAYAPCRAKTPIVNGKSVGRGPKTGKTFDGSTSLRSIV